MFGRWHCSKMFSSPHTLLAMIYMATIFVILFFCTKRKRRRRKRSKSNSNRQRKRESQSTTTKTTSATNTTFPSITPDEGLNTPAIVNNPILDEAVQIEEDHINVSQHLPLVVEPNIEDETSDINEDDVETSIKQNTSKEKLKMPENKTMELLPEKKATKKSVTFNEEVQIKSDTELIGNDLESVIASGKDEIISPSVYLKAEEIDDASPSQRIREGFFKLYKASVFSPQPALPTGHVFRIPHHINKKLQKIEKSQKKKAKKKLIKKLKKS